MKEKGLQAMTMKSTSCPPATCEQATAELKTFLSHIPRSLEALQNVSGDTFVIRYDRMDEDHSKLVEEYLSRPRNHSFQPTAQALIDARITRELRHSLVVNDWKDPSRNPLTPLSTVRAACCILVDEFTAFQKLITDAVNLPAHGKNSSLAASANLCGFDSMATLHATCAYQ